MVVTDWHASPVAEFAGRARARERGSAVGTIPADHHFVGQADGAGTLVSTFFTDSLER